MSMADLAYAMRGVLDDITAARGMLATAIDSAVRAHNRATAVTVGSGHRLVAQTLAGLEATMDPLRRADLDLAAAAAAIVEYGHIIGVSLPVPARPRPAAVIRPSAGPPAFVDRMAAELRALLPRGTKVVGQLATADGQRVGDPIWSGLDGPARGAPGLRSGNQKMPWNQIITALHHVEGHAAALMRRPDGPRDAVLVLSEEPCDDIPWGCRRILPAVLPRGSRLTIYVMGRDGRPNRWGEVFGTGEGVVD